MEIQNPYRPPGADVSTPQAGGFDETSPVSPSGRFGRLSFIAWVVIVSVVGNFITAVFGVSGAVSSEIGGAAPVAVFIIALGTVVLYVIFSIRRCHDFNSSGWWVILSLIPLVNLFFFLYLVLKRGDEGANSYAPPRITAGWEQVVGVLGVVLILVMLVGVITGIAIPVFFTGYRNF